MREISENEMRLWRSNRSVEIPIGGYCEYPTWKIKFNSLETDHGDFNCPHVIERVVYKYVRYDGSIIEVFYAIVPRVVIAKNEGGDNITTVCLDCILLAAKENA